MVRPDIISQEPVTLAEVKSSFNKLKERELNFRAGKCEEYLNEFEILSFKKAGELRKKIESLGLSRLKPEHIVKIIDLLPSTVEEAKLIFQGGTVTPTKKDLEQIVKLVNE